jgi:hypothetical protein
MVSSRWRSRCKLLAHVETGHCGIEAKQDILYHRGEAMRIIHERLANLEGVNKGLLISVIVTILSFEVG